MKPHEDSQRSAVIHVYDGIEEEDNRLPNWWLAILFATILFAFVYWFVYHTADLRPTPAERYRAQVEQLLAERSSLAVAGPQAIEALLDDPEAMAVGAEVFRTTCASCHGMRGEGLIGPNLTDAFWIHPADPVAILRLIQDGVPDKGMPPWGGMLGPERSMRAAAYVLTLRGTNLPGKEPQGERVE